jgi:enediyne biosynthesis protein E4
MLMKHFYPLLLLLLVSACGKSGGDPRLTPAIPPETAVPPTTRFQKLSPEQTGIQFTPVIAEEHRYNFIADPYIYNGGGVAVLDVNNDGLQDLFFTARLQGCRLYLNKGGLTFQDISESAGVNTFSGLKTGVNAVDINADGWMDLYVCRTWLEPVPERRNLLFINNKNNTFTEQAAAYQLDDLSASQHANFFDYDLDGDLDCYIVNHPVDFKTINNLDHTGTNARREMPRDQYESDRLLQNNGQVFTDVTEKAGIRNRAFGLSSFATDINADGWPDLVVGNDFVMPDFLYINNKNGTFTDQAEQYFRYTSNHTMGMDMADVNHDGLSDLVALDMLAEALPRRHQLMNTMQRTRDRQMQEKGYGRQVMRNTLQLNQGGQFSEMAQLAGISATDWSWAPLLADYDNDGWSDLFISNGIQRDLNDLDFFVFTADSINRTGGISKARFPNFNDFVGLMPSEPVHPYMYQNTGSLVWNDVSEAWGFDQKGFSNGAAYADLDNDGDLDLITNNLQAPPTVFENKATSVNQNHWLQIKCAGSVQNPQGTGATVHVFVRDKNGALQRAFYQEMTPTRGFYSSVEPMFQIGLGTNQQVARIELNWAEGKHQILENIPANQRLLLRLADASPGKTPPIAPLTACFEPEKPLGFVHHENTFEDFDREKLLPHRLSRLGPCLSSADWNGDALSDLYVGGAAGQAGKVFVQQLDGSFLETNQPVLEQDKAYEDVASAAFDADGDGDQDIWVVSGGNEAPDKSPLYQDRLYLNDGKGVFSAAKNAIPQETTSGGCIQVFDYDRDGKPDVFTGGRCVPGQFPSIPISTVYHNEGGHFKPVTSMVAPAFEKVGMVTDLQFGDLDGDQMPEMVVVGDWMPLCIFHWTGQSFQMTQTTDTYGWWRCVQLSDLDQDGDLDILAGNMGLNHRFQATSTAPLRLFAQDFDKNGSLDPILAQAVNNSYRPVAQRELLASQIPSIKKKYPRNAPYAQAVIEELFPNTDWFSEHALEAQTFETQWFKNEAGKFVAQTLPKAAQIAPVDKVLVSDFTGDGQPDVLLLGNDTGFDIETYNQNNSRGCLLQGIGNGQFVPLEGAIHATMEVRDAVLMPPANGKKRLIVANNNGPIQVFMVRSSKN